MTALIVQRGDEWELLVGLEPTIRGSLDQVLDAARLVLSGNVPIGPDPDVHDRVAELEARVAELEAKRP